MYVDSFSMVNANNFVYEGYPSSLSESETYLESHDLMPFNLNAFQQTEHNILRSQVFWVATVENALFCGLVQEINVNNCRGTYVLSEEKCVPSNIIGDV